VTSRPIQTVLPDGATFSFE